MALQLTDREPARFPGDFRVEPAPNAQPTPAEAEFVRTLDARVTANDPFEGVLTKIERLRGEDGALPDGPLKTELLKTLQDCSQAMRGVAQRVIDGRSPNLGVADLFVEEGRCSKLREQLTASRFVVTPDVSPETGLVQDVDIWVNPNPVGAATPQQQDLFVAVGETSSVIRIVCEGWNRSERRGHAWVARTRAENIRHEYLGPVFS
jgi:hypothetical protein